MLIMLRNPQTIRTSECGKFLKYTFQITWEKYVTLCFVNKLLKRVSEKNRSSLVVLAFPSSLSPGLATVNELERVVLSQIVRKCIFLRSRKHGRSENLATIAVPTETRSKLGWFGGGERSMRNQLPVWRNDEQENWETFESQDLQFAIFVADRVGYETAKTAEETSWKYVAI